MPRHIIVCSKCNSDYVSGQVGGCPYCALTDWHDKYLFAAELVAGMYEAVTQNTGEPNRGVLEDIQDRVAEMDKNDALFRKVIDKLTADNGGIIPCWLLDLAP